MKTRFVSEDLLRLVDYRSPCSSYVMTELCFAGDDLADICICGAGDSSASPQISDGIHHAGAAPVVAATAVRHHLGIPLLMISPAHRVELVFSYNQRTDPATGAHSTCGWPDNCHLSAFGQLLGPPLVAVGWVSSVPGSYCPKTGKVIRIGGHFSGDDLRENGRRARRRTPQSPRTSTNAYRRAVRTNLPASAPLAHPNLPDGLGCLSSRTNVTGSAGVCMSNIVRRQRRTDSRAASTRLMTGPP